MERTRSLTLARAGSRHLRTRNAITCNSVKHSDRSSFIGYGLSQCNKERVVFLEIIFSWKTFSFLDSSLPQKSQLSSRTEEKYACLAPLCGNWVAHRLVMGWFHGESGSGDLGRPLHLSWRHCAVPAHLYWPSRRFHIDFFGKECGIEKLQVSFHLSLIASGLVRKATASYVSQ